MLTDAFKEKVVVVTGGANCIGRCIANEFRSRGAIVYVIDKQEGKHFIGDISKKEVLEIFVEDILSKHNKVDIIINNALPLMKGINECSYEEFQYALSVGVTAPFYLVKLLMSHLAEGASIINISSTRDRMSQPQTESYTVAKGGIAALTHALAISLAGRARVNSISPTEPMSFIGLHRQKVIKTYSQTNGQKLSRTNHHALSVSIKHTVLRRNLRSNTTPPTTIVSNHKKLRD